MGKVAEHPTRHRRHGRRRRNLRSRRLSESSGTRLALRPWRWWTAGSSWSWRTPKRTRSERLAQPAALEALRSSAGSTATTSEARHGGG